MSNWFNHVHLVRLSQAIVHSDCDNRPEFFEPISKIRFKNQELINACDPAILKFMQALDMPTDDNWQRPDDICKKLLDWLKNNHLGPGTYDGSLLDELFELRSTSGGWRELDRLLRHMTDHSLSNLVDTNTILHQVDDPGLHGAVCYSVFVHTCDADKFMRAAECKALASTAERIVPLALGGAQVVKTDFDKVQAMKSMKPRFTLPIEKILWEPYRIEIKKNGKRLWSAPVIDSTVPGLVEIDWASIQVDAEDIGMMKALLTIAPADSWNVIKGKFLQEQLGL
jgi:hypothetical protein